MIFNFPQIFSALQIKDVFDILFIALIIYIGFILLLRTKLWRAIFSLLVLFLLYSIIIFFDLPISKYFFNYFFQILAVVLIIVFQKEIRKFFEFLFFPHLKRLKIKNKPSDNLINEILEAVSWFQKTKTGAIIVFSGLDPLDDYIEGGYYLDGKVSAPLLISIFDKHSPGHDGAVIIEFDKIVKFGAHLPLAENLDLVKKFGTRHRAGLGISEKTDSLVLIVSEETGEVSLAYKGEIRSINNLDELKSKIIAFLKEKYYPKIVPRSMDLLKNYFLPVIVSLFLAFVLWFFFSVQATIVQKTFLVPVEFYNLPPNMVLAEISDSQVAIVLKGKEQDFKLLDEKNLKISIDVSNLSPGHQKVLITKDNIKNIKNFELVEIEPSIIKFYLKIKEEDKVEGID